MKDVTKAMERAIFKRELSAILKEFPEYTIGQCLLRIIRPSCDKIGDLYEVTNEDIISNTLEFRDNERE